ncbi:MAG: hypothetical protein K2N87_03980 [Eubacterium sp.]|nr:hypothetical protein [Eubacterium sp.]
MDIKKSQKFIEKLSADTIRSKIQWVHASEYETLEYDSNPNVSRIFFQWEFRHIDFNKSYFAHLSSGIIFIIFENNESGYDGSLMRGYHVYIQNDLDVYELPCQQGVIYQLINSIESYLAKSEEPIEHFLESYMASS